MKYIWDYMDKNAYNNYAGRYKTNIQLNFILNNSGKKIDKILDVGGGAGRFAIPLLERCDNITVIDINNEAIQILNERNKDIHTISGDFMEVELNDTFSLITCIEVLPYFKNWNDFFKKISHLLDTNGRFIFTFTNPNSWRYFLRKLKNINKPNPYREMNFKDFKKLLAGFNFEIDKVDGMNWIPLPVTSNSIFVNLFAHLERILHLGKWHSQSPWLLISIKKRQS